MADKVFVARNGLQVNGSLLFANNGKVGVNTASPDAALTVAGAANVHSNLSVNGQIVIVVGGIKFPDNSTLNSAPTGISMSGNATFDRYYSVNGTSGVPAHSYTSDTDTGMYLSGANEQSFVAGGTVYLTGNTTVVTIPSAFTVRIGSFTVNSTAIGNNVTFSNNITVSSNLSVTGTTSLNNTTSSGTQSFSGNTTLSGNAIFTGTVAMRANISNQTLTDGATVNWNMDNGQIATLTLTGTGRTMAAPTNLKVGTYILHVIQDATGNRTITTWNSVFKWTAGVAPILSTTAGARDVFSFICDGTNLYGSYMPDVR